MLMQFTSDAVISSSRLSTFLSLPERDPGIVIKVKELNPHQIDKLPNLENKAISITGNPSFAWATAKDKTVPPILDPFYKENLMTMKIMNKGFNASKLKYRQ